MYRQKRRKRIRTMSKRLAIILFTCMLFTVGITIASERKPQTIKIVTETVTAHDTLWDIAEKYNKQGVDIRRFVAEIAEFNGLDGYLIHPGDTIEIPLYESRGH